ncbi:hypothetical protein RM543_06005 [Roseicyclus sp. F158]|uniref:DUF3313 domain-containing protein n=1 Tax=Tropicimonas omnivorans TaxID=3075590 RepID=A0ABU3DEW5_9RHOB|nr:hypothetical protein [Roseicyclus sp. F158]MDT0682230.1 hypothetical protein [Roseicyclus sp. F158]
MRQTFSTMIRPLSRGLFAGVLFAGLSACSPTKDLDEPLEPLGDFAVGYTIVVADNAQKVGPSRTATPDEWEASLKEALDQRFGRFEGDKLYHVAASIDGYALAVPGIPIVLSPKSALVVSVSVWDDAAQAKLNAEPKQIVALERLSGETVVGSGLTQSKEEQMRNLSQNAARLIERWMRENGQWFGAEPIAPLTTGDSSDD